MSGPRDTQIEIVASRRSATGAKIRVSAFVSRDVGTMPKIARPGVDVEIDPGGLRIVDVVAGTSAAETELQPGDLIFQIDDEFIAGLGVQEAWSKLWGDFGTAVDISASRQAESIKSCVSCTVERDHNSSIQMPTKPPLALVSKLKNLPAMVSTLNTPVQSLKESKRKKKSGGVNYFLIALSVALLAFLVHKCTTIEQCNSAVLYGMHTLHKGYTSVKDSAHVVKAMKHINHGYKSIAFAGASVVPAIYDRAIQTFKAAADAGARAAPGITDRAKAVYKAASSAGSRAAPVIADQSTIQAPSFIEGASQQSDAVVSAIKGRLSSLFPGVGEGRADKTTHASDPGLPVAGGFMQTVSQHAGEAFQTVRKSLPLWSSAESHGGNPAVETGSTLSVVDDAMRRIEEARKAMELSMSSSAASSKEAGDVVL
jgi:hypothetical protein